MTPDMLKTHPMQLTYQHKKCVFLENEQSDCANAAQVLGRTAQILRAPHRPSEFFHKLFLHVGTRCLIMLPRAGNAGGQF
jgi:hypothetical protein